MNPGSSARFAMVETIAVVAAPRPLETATSDSAICRDTTETSAGETKARKLSTIVAIASSACLYELAFGRLPQEVIVICNRKHRSSRIRARCGRYGFWAQALDAGGMWASQPAVIVTVFSESAPVSNDLPAPFCRGCACWTIC